jgi:hypothetical protein
MNLPVRVIDRLFERLLATYGAQWQGLWAGVPIADVKSLWAAELAVFGERLEAIGWALERLPERPPNLVQFKALCRDAPRAEAPALPLPDRDPARMAQALQSLRVVAGGDGQPAVSGQPVRVGAISGGRTPAQAVVDVLIARGEERGLILSQVAVLRAAVQTLRDDDPRRQNHVVARHVPAQSEVTAAPQEA